MSFCLLADKRRPADARVLQRFRICTELTKQNVDVVSFCPIKVMSDLWLLIVGIWHIQGVFGTLTLSNKQVLELVKLLLSRIQGDCIGNAKGGEHGEQEYKTFTVKGV